MEQVAWAALGILAASLLGMFGMFISLGNRIDSKFDAMDAKFDAVNARIDALGARFDGRIDSVISRLDNLADRFTTHIEKHHSS